MKILFVQLGRIGDMLLATPVFSALKVNHPDCRLDVLAGRHNHQCIVNNPNVDSILIWDKSPSKLLKLIHVIRKCNYDFHIDPKDHHSSESAIIAKISRAVNKIGYNKQNKKTFNIQVPDSSANFGKHYTIRCLQALEPLGIVAPEIPPRPALFINPDSEKYASDFIETHRIKNFVVLNLSASAEKKMWENERWDEFLRAIDIKKTSFVLCYAPTEREKAKQLLDIQKELIEFKSRSINDAIALIGKSKLLISPDTALVHVAAAFNIPLVGLYSGLDDFYAKFAPLSEKQAIVRAEPGDWGIKSIKTEQVIMAYKRIAADIFQ